MSRSSKATSLSGLLAASDLNKASRSDKYNTASFRALVYVSAKRRIRSQNHTKDWCAFALCYATHAPNGLSAFMQAAYAVSPDMYEAMAKNPAKCSINLQVVEVEDAMAAYRKVIGDSDKGWKGLRPAIMRVHVLAYFLTLVFMMGKLWSPDLLSKRFKAACGAFDVIEVMTPNVGLFKENNLRSLMSVFDKSPAFCSVIITELLQVAAHSNDAHLSTLAESALTMLEYVKISHVKIIIEQLFSTMSPVLMCVELDPEVGRMLKYLEKGLAEGRVIRYLGLTMTKSARRAVGIEKIQLQGLLYIAHHLKLATGDVNYGRYVPGAIHVDAPRMDHLINLHRSAQPIFATSSSGISRLMPDELKESARAEEHRYKRTKPERTTSKTTSVVRPSPDAYGL